MQKNETIDNIYENKLNNMSILNDNKINEILNVIQDLNKITEENEFSINELKENFRKIQTDNINLIKNLQIIKEKNKQIDYILEQITNIKNSFSKVLNIYENNYNEEENFIENYLIKNNESISNKNNNNE